MLGLYENFPAIPHAKASFTCPSPTKTLQEAIVCTLNRLNTQEIGLDTITHAPPDGCKIGFEFGIAEGTTFNYLNPEETERFRKTLAKKETVLNIDFLCVVKYHLSGSEKRQPLKFDHFLLRFIFRRPEMQLRVLHEKGTQHVSIEELIGFLTEQINTELTKTKAKPLKLGTIMHPVPIESL